jgi:uncharacterized cysteine cluster protein YcgN (CxxCxxCC family)
MEGGEMKPETWEEFFDRCGEYAVSAFFYENRQGITIEELYQMFKQRMEEEKERP